MSQRTRNYSSKFFIALLSVLLFAFSAFAATVPTVPNKPHDVYAKNGMVSAAHELASKAGLEIMKKGGNAIDAAVATALALNVVEPYNIGMGGGGFATVRFAKTGEVVFIDFRETAPASARKDMYASEQAKKEHWSARGGRAAGVPGYLAGWFFILEKYGTMSFGEVAAPAIKLAEEGYVWTEGQTGTLQGSHYEDLYNFNNEGKNVPYFVEGLPREAGTVVKHPGLAKAFRLLAKDGKKAFYSGPIGEALVKAVNASGGNMTMKDLANYKVIVRKPVEGSYRGYKIYSSAPPSSGGAHVIQLLNFMENYDISKKKAGSPELMDMWGKAERMVFADRDKYMADTDFVSVPLEGITSKEYAKTMTKNYDPASKLPELGKPGDPWKFDKTNKKVSHIGDTGPEHFSTTHFSTVDKEGNIVAATNTINYWFGCKIMLPDYQIFVNNQMDDFSSNPESVNAPEPGKRPLSSMSPTVMLDPQGRSFMTLGASGSRMILTVVAQVISNVIDHKMTMSQAIEAPRIWNDMDGETILEATAGKTVIDSLTKKGYKLNLGETYHGVCQGIIFDHEKNQMDAAADQRTGTGMPAGF